MGRSIHPPLSLLLLLIRSDPIRSPPPLLLLLLILVQVVVTITLTHTNILGDYPTILHQ